MGKADPRPFSRVDAWVRRLFQVFLYTPEQPPSTSAFQDQAAEFQTLSLAIAACSELSQELPELLLPLERSLNLAAPKHSACRLLLAVQLKGQQEIMLIPAQQQGPSPDCAAFLRDQLKGESTTWACGQSHILELPGSAQQLQLIPLPVAEFQGWLITIGNCTLPAAAARRFEAIARAVGQGLNVWHGHQKRLEAAVRHERHLHAAELHDSLAQILGYLRLSSSRLDARCSRCDQPELQTIAADLSQQTAHAYRLMRELISSSRIALEGGSLHSALRATVKEFEQRSGLIFELDDRCQEIEPDENRSLQLVMITREALCNAVRHAQASHLRVQLFPLGKGLRMRIEDNGQGIDKTQARQDSYGLEIMRERALRAGAALTISNRPGGGTRIELILENMHK